jgi:hypothetical protein
LEVFRRFLSGGEAHGAFQALTRDAGAGDAAEGGGFWSADIVAVEARDGVGLQDVEFDEFHGLCFVGFVVFWIYERC